MLQQKDNQNKIEKGKKLIFQPQLYTPSLTASNTLSLQIPGTRLSSFSPCIFFLALLYIELPYLWPSQDFLKANLKIFLSFSKQYTFSFFLHLKSMFVIYVGCKLCSQHTHVCVCLCGCAYLSGQYFALYKYYYCHHYKMPVESTVDT